MPSRFFSDNLSRNITHTHTHTHTQKNLFFSLRILSRKKKRFSLFISPQKSLFPFLL
jgi:hypothetical protein